MDDRQFNISITTGAVLKTVLILVGAWMLYLLRDLALVVLTAVVISSAIEPGIKGLMRHRVPRILSVILIYLLLFALFFAVFFFFLPSVLEDLAAFIQSLPSYLNTFSGTGAFDTYAQLLGLPAPSTIPATVIIGSARDVLNLGVFSNVFSAIGAVFGGVFSFILIVVFSFYFAVIETGVDDFLRIVTPRRHQAYVQGLWRRSQHKIGLWMQGQLILAFLMGVLIFLGLSIFGVPHALVLAVIVSIFEIIPVFGPVLASIPAIIIGFVSGGTSLGIKVIFVYIIAQQFENHLIYPQVVTRVVGVPPLLVILALIVGGELAGFLGIILSVPAAATLQELVRDFESGRLQRHAEETA